MSRGHYGWVPDTPDHRDMLYAVPRAVSVALPVAVDLRKQCPPVYDQGQLGSCTGNAIGAAVQFSRMKQKVPTAKLVPSRLFIYYNERVMEHTIRSDAGAMIRDGIKSVAKQGVVFETGANAWPYVVSKFATKPPVACYKAALKDNVASYQRVSQTLSQLKGCLASGYPFVFGFTVYEAFESDEVARTGVLSLPARSEQALGGHAVLCVGYDDGAARFIVRNSWGKSWGKSGYFTMPYSYVLDPNLADDIWTVRLVNDG